MKRFTTLLLILTFTRLGLGEHEVSGVAAQIAAGVAARQIAETTRLNDQAREIFRLKCFDCHRGGSQGDPHNMFETNGPRAGFPRVGHEGVTVHTITAHRTNRVHMPPNGAEQLTTEEIAVLRRWAAANGDRNIPTSLTQAIERQIFRRENLVSTNQLKEDLRNNRAVRIWNIGPMEDIRGAVRIGALSDNASVNRLNEAERALPNRNETILLYCGCCELETCPNVLRALYVLNQRGYTQVKVLNLPHSLSEDWDGPMAERQP